MQVFMKNVTFKHVDHIASCVHSELKLKQKMRCFLLPRQENSPFYNWKFAADSPNTKNTMHEQLSSPKSILGLILLLLLVKTLHVPRK